MKAKELPEAVESEVSVGRVGARGGGGRVAMLRWVSDCAAVQHRPGPGADRRRPWRGGETQALHQTLHEKGHYAKKTQE